MSNIDLTRYGITGTKEIVYNPSYELLYKDEMDPSLTGFDKGQESELGAVNVMTGVYTGRSPKDKYIVMDENSKDTVWWTSDAYKNDNHPMTEDVWQQVKALAQKQLSGKKLYVVDAFCGANKDTRMAVRFIMENIPFFISPPYQVFRITCSRLVTLKATTVSLLRPSSLYCSHLAFDAVYTTKSGSNAASSSAVGLMNILRTK